VSCSWWRAKSDGWNLGPGTVKIVLEIISENKTSLN